MDSHWFETTSNELTYILAEIMQIKPSKADRIVNATVAKLGAAGSAAGVYGVASLFGTAGTGTAIGTLSGAAANSATLAWVGGSVFTGTIIVTGIALVGGWSAMRLWKGKPRKYDNLSNTEQNIVNACATLAKAFKEQSKLETLPSKSELSIVVQDGLVPLNESLSNYLKLRDYKVIVTGRLSAGGRSRLFFRQRKLASNISEAERWADQYATK